MRPYLALKTIQLRRAWIPYFVLAIALTITAGATSYVATTAKAKDRLQFQNAVQRAQDDIQNRLETYVALLRASSGLFAASDQVNREEFRAFVNRLRVRDRYPGVQGIGFSVHVTPAEKDALVAQMKRQGVENFSIRPNSQRREYHSIIYLEPQDRRNQVAIGFDMFTEPVRRAAMERARDTGTPTASGRVTLVQEIDQQKQPGFLIYVPVYRDSEIPNTVAARRARLIGFVYSPFRADDLFQEIFGNEKYPYIDFQIYDGRNLKPENLLYSSYNPSTKNGAFYKPRFATTTNIEIAGRSWSITFASRPQLEQASESQLIPYFVLGGILISFVLFSVTRSQVHARDAAERSAALARSSEEALRQSEERYRAFIEQSSEGIWRFELEQPIATELSEEQQIQHFYQYAYLAECNDVMAQMYGIDCAAELVGTRLGDFLVQSDPHNVEYLCNFIRSGYKLNAAESYEVDKEGKPKYFLNSLVGIVANGVLVRAWGTQLDITERKQTEQALRQSEERLRLVVQNMPVLMDAFDVDGNIIIWNQESERVTGYNAAEIVGNSKAMELLYPDADYRERSLTAWQERGNDYRDWEWQITCKDGSIKTVSWSNVSDHLPIPGWATWGIGVDITERKQAETALRLSEERFRMLLENVKDYAIFLLDTKARVVRWSAGAEKIFGYQEAEILGQPGSVIFTPEDLQRGADKEELNKAVTEGQAEDERWHLRKGGSRFWASGIMTTLRDQTGQLQGFAKILRDFTERKQAEEEREHLLKSEQAARAEAEAANRMKDEFLATLSHELRTPLNAMLGWTSLLRNRKFDEKTTDRALETIDRNTKSLAQLIEDVLDVSRIITGKLRLNLTPIELVPIIEAAIETALPAAEAKNIQINSRLDASVGSLLGDANRLQQVFWNLLSNAVKFTPKGGRVEVRLERINSRIQVSVSDTGQGISPDFLPYVFERFRQADSSSTRSHGGLGLGLAIVRHLVELHGGTVYAESQGEGQGATFIVNLPLRAVRVQTSEPKQRQLEVVSEVPQICPPSLRGLRVLVVDDEADARELLTTMLAQYEAEVIAVATASEALEAIKKSQPDVLVSDIGMPGEDGYSLIRRVRALAVAEGGRIPSVALTAYARAEDRKQALLAGFQLHVPKPVDPVELAVVVGNLAGRS